MEVQSFNQILYSVSFWEVPAQKFKAGAYAIFFCFGCKAGVGNHPSLMCFILMAGLAAPVSFYILKPGMNIERHFDVASVLFLIVKFALHQKKMIIFFSYDINFVGNTITLNSYANFGFVAQSIQQFGNKSFKGKACRAQFKQCILEFVATG